VAVGRRGTDVAVKAFGRGLQLADGSRRQMAAGLAADKVSLLTAKVTMLLLCWLRCHFIFSLLWS